MKKQTKIIIGIILSLAVIIIVVSFLFPSVYKGLTSGSFGKADKYRQDQMSEADIQLRSEFVQDTAKLEQMISGLIYYSLFTENLTMSIDTCMVSFKMLGFDKDPSNTEAISLLTSYNTFLKNNTTTIANTTRMLAAFLLNDTASGSMDIEKNLKDFANYVNQVNDKDSVLTIALVKLDHFIIGNKALQKNTAEIRNLKAIRDQLVIKSTQFMAMTGNKQGIGSMLNYVVSSQSQFSGIGALKEIEDASRVVQSKLNLIEAPGARVNSATLCGGFSLSSFINSMGSKDNLNLVLYDKAGLNFTLCSADQLKLVWGADKMGSMMNGTNQTLGVMMAFNAKSLGVVLSAGPLCAVNSSLALRGALSASQLNIIIPAKELSAVNMGLFDSRGAFGSSAPLQMGYCGSTSLLGLVNSNVDLRALFGSNGFYSGFGSFQAVAMNSMMNSMMNSRP